MPDGRFVTPTLQDCERLQGFQADWTQPAETVAKRGFRWKLVGNAVSVLAAEWLGERLAHPGAALVQEPQQLRAGSRWPRAAYSADGQRFSNQISVWPKALLAAPLAEFLSPNLPLLSARATAGFLGRAARSQLRFPPGFIDALNAHLAAVRLASAA